MSEEYFPADRLLELGVGSNIQAILENTDIQYHTTFIGIDKGHSVITSLAAIQSASDSFCFENAFKQGSVFEMRAIHNGYIYAFETEYVGNWEGEMLITSYPEMVETRGLRAAKRYPCALSCDIFFEGREMYGAITNISHGGCQIKLKQDETAEVINAMLNQRLTLDVYFSSMGKPVGYAVKVVSAYCEVDGVCKLGVSFDHDYDSIRRYLESLHLDSISPFFK